MLGYAGNLREIDTFQGSNCQISDNGSTPKGNNALPLGANSYLFD